MKEEPKKAEVPEKKEEPKKAPVEQQKVADTKINQETKQAEIDADKRIADKIKKEEA
tara:strand:+ start:512 stop:682 length:171 start_codon:yes stop_codon:yes gene_type:complete